MTVAAEAADSTAFQIRVQPDGHSAAGQWLGFSEATKTVKTGGLYWQRIREM